MSESRVERYELLGELATGGMATVYLGRQHGPFGFTRTVAIKSMHPQYAKDETFRSMFLDEATLTARIRHPNVVPTLDIVHVADRLLLVMEYVDGVALAGLLEEGKTLRPSVAVAVMRDVLNGLHAAHELVDEAGHPLTVVHRDVSPQNVLVGRDGFARVLDFGVAKAATRRHVTKDNTTRGKLAYMAPEQLRGEPTDRRTDIYSAAAVLWETLTGRRLFVADNEGELVRKVLEGRIDPPSFISDQAVEAGLDDVIMKALSAKPGDRWATAREMAEALVLATAPASTVEVGAVVAAAATRDPAARARSGAAVPLEEQVLTKILTAWVTDASIVRGGPRWRSVMRAVGGALLLLAAFAGGALVVRPSRANRDDDARGSRQDRAEASLPAPTGSEAAPPSPSPAASPPEPPRPSSASPAHDRPPPIATVLSRSPAGRSKAAPKPSVGTGPDCSVLYTVDENGDRHYKTECLR